MKNLFLFLVTSSGFLNLVSSQTEFEWKNANEHYRGRYDFNKDCLYHESNLTKSEIGVSMKLQKNIYVVTLKICEKQNDSIDASEFKFDGRYTVNEKGHLNLQDQHPFSSNEFRIRERVNKHSTDENLGSREIKVKLRDQYKMYGRKKMLLKHQSCLIKPVKEDYRIPSYYPMFYPDYVKVKQESLTSVKRSIDQQMDTSSFELGFGSRLKFHISDTINIFAFVDSLKFDTVYISKAYYLFNGFTESPSGKSTYQRNNIQGYFELSKVVKLNIKSFMYSLGEYGELYVEPSLGSKSIYFYREGDKIENIRLTDFAKDRYGQKWVRIEFDLVESYDYNPPAHYTGWLLQDALVLY